MSVEEGRRGVVMIWSWCQGGAGLGDKGAGVGVWKGRRGRSRRSDGARIDLTVQERTGYVVRCGEV